MGLTLDLEQGICWSALLPLVVNAHAQETRLAVDWRSELSCIGGWRCPPLEQLGVPVLAWLFIAGAYGRQQCCNCTLEPFSCLQLAQWWPLLLA